SAWRSVSPSTRRRPGAPIGSIRVDPNFAYRYCKVDTDGAGLSLGMVVDLGVRYLELALAW
ncbi:MAG TPA: hypothetical protein VET24_16985, partial [Actinomycetota bacterium]|nr:hypothetical protein [Actinomycetota bacterium]